MTEPVDILSRTAIFSALPGAALQSLAQAAQFVDIAGGQVLLREGDAGDAVYVVAAGRLRAVSHDGATTGEIARYEVVGEMSMLSGEPRMATVVASRDSQLLRLPMEEVRNVLRRYPDTLFDLSRLVISRLQRPTRPNCVASSVRTIAVIGMDAEVLAAASLSLRTCLERWGRSRMVSREDLPQALGQDVRAHSSHSHSGLSVYLDELEDQNRYVLYSGHCDDREWSRLCIRQADRVLILLDAATPDIPAALLDALADDAAQRTAIVAVCPGSSLPRHVLKWKARLGTDTHFLVRGLAASQLASVARQVTGRGVGLVLGGGGARGFAHIGLLRACAELRIPIDLLGGTSMGALIAAMAAQDRSVDEMMDAARRLFVLRNLLNDYTFPLVSIIRGRKASQGLVELFGDTQIEYLAKPFFCVSTNLSRIEVVFHDQGPLAVWVNASMRLPGIVPPVVSNEALLVDGGVLNNLPTDRMRQLGRGPILACDVSNDDNLRAEGVMGPDADGLMSASLRGVRPSLFAIMFKTATANSERISAMNSKLADHYLRMPLGGVGIFDWKKLPRIIDIGYEHAMKELEGQAEALRD